MSPELWVIRCGWLQHHAKNSMAFYVNVLNNNICPNRINVQTTTKKEENYEEKHKKTIHKSLLSTTVWFRLNIFRTFSYGKLKTNLGKSVFTLFCVSCVFVRSCDCCPPVLGCTGAPFSRVCAPCLWLTTALCRWSLSLSKRRVNVDFWQAPPMLCSAILHLHLGLAVSSPRQMRLWWHIF